MNKKKILIITGPTGVGKTDLVLKLGSIMSCEIINIDIGQFYKPFSIGTAKPDWQNELIPHHLFDILDTPRSLTVHEYREIVLETINKVWANNKLPVLVGGSGFYIQSLLFPLMDLENMENNLDTFDSDCTLAEYDRLNISSPITLPASRSLCEVGSEPLDMLLASRDKLRESDEHKHFFDLKNDNLWQVLYNIDPERAQAIDKQDNYRLKRALHIWQQTGKKPSECLPQFEPPCDFTFLVIDRNRDELYKRINERVIQMLDLGWIDEVKKIRGSEWESFLKIKKLIGYDDILKYLDSEFKDKDYLLDIIQQKTRKYAKRQLTFFRMLTSKILINACDLEIICNKHSVDNACKKIKIVWTNLTLLNDINTLFESLNN